MRPELLVIAFAGAALAALAVTAFASDAPELLGADAGGGGELQPELLPGFSGAFDSAPAPGLAELIDYSGGGINANNVVMDSDANVSAFLAMLRTSEVSTAGPDGYGVLFGFQPFNDFTTHPALAGWNGVPLTDEQCRGAGFGPGCVSTAAGGYQINKPTWDRVRARLGLPDFSPASQDAAAVELIREKGALDDVRAGRFDQAVNKVRRVWASLPGAGYAGQGTRTLAWARSQYENAGGAYG